MIDNYVLYFFLQDGNAMLWDLNEGKHLYTLPGSEVINALVFSPNRYWLCSASGQNIKIWVSKPVLRASYSSFVIVVVLKSCLLHRAY